MVGTARALWERRLIPLGPFTDGPDTTPGACHSRLTRHYRYRPMAYVMCAPRVLR
jgi:hypothetical protein